MMGKTPDKPNPNPLNISHGYYSEPARADHTVSRVVAIAAWLAFLYETVHLFHGLPAGTSAILYYLVTLVLALVASGFSTTRN